MKKHKRLKDILSILFVCCYLYMSIWFITRTSAKPTPTYGHVFVDEVIRVYDGDSFFVNIYQWPKILGENLGVRINGIDTPELRGSAPPIKEAGLKAKKFVEFYLAASNTIILKNIQRGKYFRVIADVDCDGEDLGKLLINAGLAKPYDGGTKNIWTIEDVNNL